MHASTAGTRRSAVRRLVMPIVGVALATTSLVVAEGAGPATSATTVTRITDYAFSATGFGTKVTSADASLQSGMTAYSLIGCTRAAGVDNGNSVAAGDLNDQVHAGSATTDQQSLVNRAGTSMVQSVTRIASIEIGDSSLGFRITNLQGISRAYATRAGTLNAVSTLTFGSLQPLGSTSLPPPLDQPADVIISQLQANGPVTIPDLGTVKLGHVARAVNGLAAQSGSIGLQVHLFGQDRTNGGGDDSDVLIGRSYARISRSATHGLFSGGSWGMDGRQLNGAVTLGRNPFTPMSCEGTRGRIRRTQGSGLNFANLNQLLLGSVENRVFGTQDAPLGGATGWTESSATGIDLGGGQLNLNGVLARAKVIRTSTNHYYVTAVQRIGSITANGTAQPVPRPGQSLTIPGVAKVEVPLPVKSSRGVSVVGARITLLSGTAANTVIDIANADMAMKAY